MDILKAGARFGLKHGLPLLASAISGAESFEEESTPGQSDSQLSADALAKRAVVAEAALQAVMKLPPQELEESGFFDSIWSGIKQIAPVAIKVCSPFVIYPSPGLPFPPYHLLPMIDDLHYR